MLKPLLCEITGFVTPNPASPSLSLPEIYMGNSSDLFSNSLPLYSVISSLSFSKPININ